MKYLTQVVNLGGFYFASLFKNTWNPFDFIPQCAEFNIIMSHARNIPTQYNTKIKLSDSVVLVTDYQYKYLMCCCLLFSVEVVVCG